MTCLLQTNSFTALIAQVNNLMILYNTSLNFLLPSIIIYIKQNDVHKVIILYLNTIGGETTREAKRLGGGAKRLVGAKRLGGKRLGGNVLGGETTRGRNGLGAKRPGFSKFMKFSDVSKYTIR